MSPRYEDDAPRPRGKKEIPLGLIAGCGLFAILIIGAVIWVLINLINTVGDAAKPNENETQTSVVAPSESSNAIPDDGINSNDNGDDFAITDSGDESDAMDLNQSNSDSDNNAGTKNSTANKTSEANDDNVVYVTETVTAK